MKIETNNNANALPDVYVQQLQGIDPASEEYGESIQILAGLYAEELAAGSEGKKVPTIEAVEQPEPIAVPIGYRSAVLLPSAANLNPRQFEGKIYSFADERATEGVDIIELETENGKTLHVCDLRPLMTSQVKKGGPKGPATKKILDKDFFNDVKKHADHITANHPEKSPGGKNLPDVAGVRYSSVSGTQIRTYWMAVRDENAPNTMTIARLADCDDGANFERRLFKRVFHTQLSKK